MKIRRRARLDHRLAQQKLTRDRNGLRKRPERARRDARMVAYVDPGRFGDIGDARIARRAIKCLKERALGQFPGECVLASAPADQKNVHVSPLVL